jgi:hypothetical protein
MTEERRRSRRYSLLREEIAVIHDLHHDRPATLIDFNSTGALFALVEFPAIPENRLKVDDRLELSLQGDTSPFYVRAKIVRRGPQFLAVEFTENRADSLDALNEKTRRLADLQMSQRREARA